MIEKYAVSGASDEDSAPDKVKRQKLIAGFVYNLVHDNPPFSLERQKETAQTFEEKYEHLPAIEEAPQMPVWGPLENEEWGEPYNRAIAALQIFSLDLTRWGERQGKAGGLDSKTSKRPLAKLAMPSFMRGQSCESQNGSSGLVRIRDPVEMLQAKKFTLYWANPKSDKDSLEETYGSLPSSSLLGPDPRSLPAAEWRDKVRVLYEFERLSINFDSIRFTWQEDQKDEEDLDLISCDWNHAQETFTRLPEKDIGKIRFKTRSLFQNEVLQEWKEVPTILKSYITSSNGRIEKLQPLPIESPPLDSAGQSLDESRECDLDPEDNIDPPSLLPFGNEIGNNATQKDQARSEESEEWAQEALDESRGGDFDPEDNIDPALLALGNQIGNIVAQKDQARSEDMEALIFDPTSHPIEVAREDDSHATFVERFMAINVIANHKLARQKPAMDFAFTTYYTGNSRDKPTLFRYSCPNAPFGCTYTTTDHVYMDNQHSRFCSIEKLSESKSNPFTCNHGDCRSAFKTESDLRTHIKKYHTAWVDRSCGGEGDNCDPNYLFKSQSELQLHQTKFHHHFNYTPTTCGIPGCTSKAIFQTPASMNSHLRKQHSKEEAATAKTRPEPRRAKFKPRKCPVENCKSETVWKKEKHLLEHLKTRKHGLSEEEVNVYIRLE